MHCCTPSAAITAVVTLFLGYAALRGLLVSTRNELTASELTVARASVQALHHQAYQQLEELREIASKTAAAKSPQLKSSDIEIVSKIEAPQLSQSETSACVAEQDQSQWAEGRQLFEWFFNNLTVPGFYLEMGALDGHELSNTYSFEKCLGWRGLLIEPTEAQYQMIGQHRNTERNIVLNQAVCSTVNGHVEFTAPGAHPATNGRPELMADGFAKQHHGAEAAELQTIQVVCNPLSHIFSKHSIKHVDFWSLDVEGAELSVLQTVDLTAVTISVLLIENSEESDAQQTDRKRQTVAKVHSLLRAARMLPYARVGPRHLPYKSEVWVSDAFMQQLDGTPSECIDGQPPTNGEFLGQSWARQCFHA